MGSTWVFAVALAASVLVYHQMWADPWHRAPGNSTHLNDPMQTMWNLKWVPWQLWHGHDPFHTRAIYFPHGVGLSWNTLTPTLGILAAPLTFGLGVTFSFAVLLTLGPALTVLTAFWWLRRHVDRAWAAAVGGLVIGFNPYMTGHLQGHLDLSFAALIPVMLILLEDLFWRMPRPRRRTAVLLALVTAAQAGISEELILITAIAVGASLAFSVLTNRRATMVAIRRAWLPLLGAFGVFLLAASVLLVHQLFLSPYVQLHAGNWRATVGDYFAPLHAQLVDPHWRHLSYLGRAEDGVYVGPLLAAVLVIGLVFGARRDRAVRLAGMSLAVLVLLTFGDAHPFGIPLPWFYLEQLPGITSILPARFSFASYLVIGWLIGYWLNALANDIETRRRAGGPASGSSLGLLAVLLAVITLVPKPIEASSLPPQTTFFTTSASRSMLPAGSAVLLLPAPTAHDASGMFYQQQADFRFNQPGGYALRPDHGNAAYGPPASALIELNSLALANSPYPEQLVARGRAQLVNDSYRAIVVIQSAASTAAFAELAQRLAGREPDDVISGVEIWRLTSVPGSP